MNVNILENPILQNILSTLRDKNTNSNDFRQNLRHAGYLMTYEIIGKECTPEKTNVKTFFKKTSGVKVKESILQIMTLRAGEPLAEGGALLLDEIRSRRSIGVVDAKRVEEAQSSGLEMDFKIDLGSFKVPDFKKEDIIIVYDPMLATASTLIRILRMIKEKGEFKKLIVCCVIASEYGIERLNTEMPDVIIYALGVDSDNKKGLNKKGYIVPGLGDAGDRAFGS
ncbi:hypothetical protein AYK26_05250 [Euryarchaeota archaeon SM23-78]|nr:MAG: hypothetical protein AYK26_05250 [Euryarchaeota archaeon SM23-78]MBW3001146.1 uracil phosphoribosyltransferase [Candidatus Woesearchaeota archaeon]